MLFLLLARGCIGGLLKLAAVLAVILAIALTIMSFMAANGNQTAQKGLTWVPRGYGQTFQGWAEKVLSSVEETGADVESESTGEQSEEEATVDDRPDLAVTLDTGSFSPSAVDPCTPGEEYTQSFVIYNVGKQAWTGGVLMRVSGTVGPEKIPIATDGGLPLVVPAHANATVMYKALCPTTNASADTEVTTYQLEVNGENVGVPLKMPR